MKHRGFCDKIKRIGKAKGGNRGYAGFAHNEEGARFVAQGTDGNSAVDEDKRWRHMRKMRNEPQKLLLPFCDKYELVNWIFDTEFNEIRNRPGHIADFEEICEYFYSDREFYRNALRMTGQNSFRDYFRTQIHPVIRELIGNLLDSEDDTEFLATFIADGTVSALIRWLNESDPEPPAEMARRVRHTMAAISRAFTVKNGDGKAAEKEAI